MKRNIFLIGCSIIVFFSVYSEHNVLSGRVAFFLDPSKPHFDDAALKQQFFAAFASRANIIICRPDLWNSLVYRHNRFIALSQEETFNEKVAPFFKIEGDAGHHAQRYSAYHACYKNVAMLFNQGNLFIQKKIQNLSSKNAHEVLSNPSTGKELLAALQEYLKLLTPSALQYQCDTDFSAFYSIKYLSSAWNFYNYNNQLLVIIPKEYECARIKSVEKNNAPSSLPIKDQALGLQFSNLRPINDPLVLLKETPWPSLKKALDAIFITHSDDEDAITWNVYLTGHGFSPWEVQENPLADPRKPSPWFQNPKNLDHSSHSSIIAGLTIPEFQAFITFFNSRVHTNLLFYDTCFASGKHLYEPYQYTVISPAGSPANRTFTMIIVSGALTDAPTFSSKDIFGSVMNFMPYNHTWILAPLFDQDFQKYFTQLEQYFNQSPEKPNRSEHFLVPPLFESLLQDLLEDPSSLASDIEVLERIFPPIPFTQHLIEYLKNYVQAATPSDRQTILQQIENLLNTSELSSHVTDADRSAHSLAEIMSSIHDPNSLNNIPMVRLANTEWFSLLDYTAHVGIINDMTLKKVLLTSQKAGALRYHWTITHENQTIHVKRNVRIDSPRSITAQLDFPDQEVILVFSEYIPVPVNMAKPSAIVSMIGGKSVHFFEALSTSLSLSEILKSFLAVRGQGHSKTFVIKKLVSGPDDTIKQLIAADQAKTLSLENVVIQINVPALLTPHLVNRIYLEYVNPISGQRHFLLSQGLSQEPNPTSLTLSHHEKSRQHLATAFKELDAQHPLIQTMHLLATPPTASLLQESVQALKPVANLIERREKGKDVIQQYQQLRHNPQTRENWKKDLSPEQHKIIKIWEQSQ